MSMDNSHEDLAADQAHLKSVGVQDGSARDADRIRATNRKKIQHRVIGLLLNFGLVAAIILAALGYYWHMVLVGFVCLVSWAVLKFRALRREEKMWAQAERGDPE